MKKKVLVIQETAWTYKGPHVQHHLFERLSLRPNFKIIVFDYDIYHIEESKNIWNRKQIYNNFYRTIPKHDSLNVIRSAYLRIPYFSRFTSCIMNFFDIIKEIRKEKPIAIVVYSISNGLIAVLLSKLFQIPIIFHYFEPLHEIIVIPWVRSFARFIARLILKNVDFTYTISEKLIRYARNEGCKPNSVEFMPMGFSITTSNSDPKKIAQLKTKFQITDDDFVIFFMGALFKFAGLKEIVEYYNEKVLAGQLKLKFLIIGNEGIYDELTRYIQENDAYKWVIMTGRLPFSELPEYITLANLCLMAFKLNDITRDIVPYKFYEYIAVNKPILSTKLPGIYKEFHNHPSVIFSPTQESLIKEIETLIHQKDHLEEIGKEGKKYLESFPTWDNLINRLLKKIITLRFQKKYISKKQKD